MIKKRPEQEIGIVTPNGHTFATPTQILQWKEDAGHWNTWKNWRQKHYSKEWGEDYHQALIDVGKNFEIVERLKEELDWFNKYNNIDSDWNAPSVRDLLQKILEGEK